ncbi:uncharacterized protein VP01_663g17 [Puccinia sorghi]|uniref:Domain of unknown function at the cortex 1 domain-containing protein n=1 Tax=Puccinia sorghi TaxID=27349 RepID=A0A0L6UH72_9BASI|nr:uncharacterized protein VP01_663g17 [Puccinia sorghi]
MPLDHHHPSPKFQVLAGPSTQELSPVNVNADNTDPFPIHTDRFQDTENQYFQQWSEMTCSIQIQGRFLQSTTVDDCMWGNSFDKPIRDRLPYGTSVALKAISLIDPCLENVAHGFNLDLTYPKQVTPSGDHEPR